MSVFAAAKLLILAEAAIRAAKGDSTFSPQSWFGDATPTERRRFARARSKLLSDGLIRAGRAGRTRTLTITQSGRDLLNELLDAA